MVIVHKLDRFSRDSLESLTARTLFKRHKIRLVSVLEPMVGSDSPEDALVEHTGRHECVSGREKRGSLPYTTKNPMLDRFSPQVGLS